MENKSQHKKRTQLSFIIRDTHEKLNRSGINCIKYEDCSSSANTTDHMFTAGRDSIIRVYSHLIDHVDGDDVDRFYQMSMSHHTDWVNDIVLCKGTNTLFSASSDTTIKIWNSSKGTLLSTLRLHKDYVKCLAYAKYKRILASAGFDKNIFLWDVSTGYAINQHSDTKLISDNKFSLYSIAINNEGTLLASGSPENCVRLWDPRTCEKMIKLKGHTHNIRSILLSHDGTQCLSASSDQTIRLWSLGQQRCISTIEAHTDGVWTLCANDAFDKVYSGGKDCRIYATDLRNSDESQLVCEETSPILSIDFGHEKKSLWVATTNSTLKNWSLFKQTNSTTSLSQHKHSNSPPPSLPLPPSTGVNSSKSSLTQTTSNELKSSSFSSLSSSFLLQTPLNTHPLVRIEGASCIKQYHILNDKRYIITKDSCDTVCIWDVLQARKLETLGTNVNYEQAIKQHQRFISIPNWFSVDLKLGVLTITLDENEWSNAWVNFRDMDLNHVKQTQNVDLNDAKVNYGCIFLESLFRNCLFIYPIPSNVCSTVIMSQTSASAINNSNNGHTMSGSGGGIDDANQSGLLRFHIPEHTPIIFSEVAGRTLHRIEVKDLANENEQDVLSNVMPSWIIDPLVNKSLPKFGRLVFILNPYSVNPSKIINKDRLSSIDLLQVKKLKEHVYQKILKLNEYVANPLNAPTDSLSTTNRLNSERPSNGSIHQETNQNGNDTISVACKTIELFCSDTLLNDLEMNLRTIKQLIWKGTGDLTILYRVKN